MANNKSGTTAHIANNKKAYFNYTVLDTYEAGIVLSGCEVKSIRNGHMSIAESYATIIQQEIWLVGCHIKPYEHAGHMNPDPLRDRKLMLHRRQINQLMAKVAQKRLTVVPLRVYWVRQRVKLELGLVQSKKLVDKRDDLKQKAINRDLEREYKPR
ncbi:SsrA-binding protein SmpB [Candidatus Marinamargulisbacteria bacterium]|jgi:SsrA-binding protein|nr:SsrA-binding protein [bacterium]MDA7564035.1 SsrA-binding protein SmpB [Candidatus Marinamargulisbacteria bacterium]|tara:strand:- start:65 stop:532 length:468 start_codon:yes stop_codon:yes gene_type:complete